MNYATVIVRILIAHILILASAVCFSSSSAGPADSAPRAATTPQKAAVPPSGDVLVGPAENYRAPTAVVSTGAPQEPLHEKKGHGVAVDNKDSTGQKGIQEAKQKESEKLLCPPNEKKALSLSDVKAKIDRKLANIQRSSAYRKRVKQAQRAGQKKPGNDNKPVEWSYTGKTAPEFWGKLSPKFSLCDKGSRQSPIDIRDPIKVNAALIKFDYQPSALRVEDNGHRIGVIYDPGSFITVAGNEYELIGAHFHLPSGERVNGRGHDMAAHLVHKDRDGRMAAVTVFFDIDRSMKTGPALLSKILALVPLEKHQTVSLPEVYINAQDFLPKERDYYAYTGSITTPPCTEDVLWLVLKKPVPMSYAQFKVLARLYNHNARPIQPSRDRLIKESTSLAM